MKNGYKAVYRKIIVAALFSTFLVFSTSLVFSPFSFAQTPQMGEPGKAATTSKSTAAAAPLLDINSASEAQLQALNGIGDKRAADIIKNRPYKGKDELVQKKIIPPAVYAGIKDKIIAKQK